MQKEHPGAEPLCLVQDCHCYKLEMSCDMKLEDLLMRMNFAQHVINLSLTKQKNVAHSDEATFTLDGEVNARNIWHYAPKKEYGGDVGGKPEQFRHTKTNYPNKVMVFLGLHSSGKTFGLKMTENQTIDGLEYCWLVRYQCVPQLKQRNSYSGTLNVTTWQKDGANVHRTKKVLSYLEGQFGSKMLAIDTIQGNCWPALC